MPFICTWSVFFTDQIETRFRLKRISVGMGRAGIPPNVTYKPTLQKLRNDFIFDRLILSIE